MQAFWNRPLSSKIRIGYCTLTDVLLNVFVFVGLTGFVRQLEEDFPSGEALSDNVIFAIEGCVALLIFTRQWSHSYSKAEVIERMFTGEVALEEGHEPFVQPEDADVEAAQELVVAAVGQQPAFYNNPYCYVPINYGHIAFVALYKLVIPVLFQAAIHFGTPSLGKAGAGVVNGLSVPAPLLYLIASFHRPDSINWASWNEASVFRRGSSFVAAAIVSAKTGVYYSAYGVLLVPHLNEYLSYAAVETSSLTALTVAAQFPVYLNNFLQRPAQVTGLLGALHQIAEVTEALLRTAYVYQFARQSAGASRDSALCLAATNFVIDLAVFLYNHCCPQPQQIEIEGEEEEQVPVEIEGKEQVPVEIAGEEQVPVEVQVLVAPVGEPQDIFLQQEEQEVPQQPEGKAQQVSPVRERGLFRQAPVEAPGKGVLARAKDFMGWMLQSQEPSP